VILYNKILERLADAGWTSYRMRREKVLPEGTLTRLRNGESITLATIDKICGLLKCQPGELISWAPDDQGD